MSENFDYESSPSDWEASFTPQYSESDISSCSQEFASEPEISVKQWRSSPPQNLTLFQGFEWYCPADYKHWDRLAKVAPALSQLGITSIWIPPACKAFHKSSTGYDVHDLYDLGEFDQRGDKTTKYGTKDELLDFIQVADDHDVDIIFDMVVNHKAGADCTEPVRAVRVNVLGQWLTPLLIH